MTFLDPFSRKYLDASESDAVRALRPGGPMDTTIVSLICKRCGEKRKESIRWFHLQDSLCPCGGEFDSKPLVDALEKLTLDHLSRTRTKEELREILKNRDG